MKSKSPEYVRSVEEYKAAFEMIQDEMTQKQHEMLTEHYKSSCHITTATDLAAAVEYSGAGGTKLQYGRLGSMVSNALGLGPLGVITLALMVPPNGFAVREWLWVMRANVAQALEELGWVTKTSDLFYPYGPVGVSKYF